MLALFDRLDKVEAKLAKAEAKNSNAGTTQLFGAAEYRASSREAQTQIAPGQKRKQGGQQGHKRRSRDLFPSEDCTHIIPCVPVGCRRCGGDWQADNTPPARHQVWDLPEIQPIIEDYQLFRGHCPCCGITTQAGLPEIYQSGNAQPC